MSTDMDLTTLAKDVATELGKLRKEGWTSGDGWHTSQKRLTGPDGAELFVNVNEMQHRGRLLASGNYPKTNGRPGRESISVGLTRPAAAIAKEINRRLLPEYLANLAEVHHYNDTERTQHEERGGVMAKVAGLFGQTYEQQPYELGRSNTYRDSFRLYGAQASGSVEATGRPDTLEMELRSVPIETALRILAILAEPAKDGAQS